MRLFPVLVALLIAVSSFGNAASFRDKYADANFKDFTKFVAHYQTLNLDDLPTFAEYLQATECDLYTSMQNSQFTMQEMQVAVQKALAAEQGQDKELHVKIPMTFEISNYNFDTQSFDIVPENRLVKVNMLQVLPQLFPLCGRNSNRALYKIPYAYYAKLNTPVSLYRIPMQRNVAQQIEAKLYKPREDQEGRIVYGLMYLTIEATTPEVAPDNTAVRATMFGDVRSIDLFIDADYKLPFSTLNYANNL